MSTIKGRMVKCVLCVAQRRQEESHPCKVQFGAPKPRSIEDMQEAAVQPPQWTKRELSPPPSHFLTHVPIALPPACQGVQSSRDPQTQSD